MEKKKPVIEVTRGKVQVAIWTHSNQEGTLCGVTVGRYYRDGEGWRSSEKISARDLRLAAKAFDTTSAWLFDRNHFERAKIDTE